MDVFASETLSAYDEMALVVLAKRERPEVWALLRVLASMSFSLSRFECDMGS